VRIELTFLKTLVPSKIVKIPFIESDQQEVSMQFILNHALSIN